MAPSKWIPEPDDTIAYRVQWARQIAGLNQRDAAEKCGLTIGEWQSIEDGRAARDMPRKLRQISRGLAVNGVPVDINWLLWGEVPDDPEEVLRFSRNLDAAGQGQFSGSDIDAILDGFPPEIADPKRHLRRKQVVAA